MRSGTMEKPKFTVNEWSFYESGIQYEPQQYFIHYKQLLDDIGNDYTFLRHVSEKHWSSLKSFWPVYLEFLKMHEIDLTQHIIDQYFLAVKDEIDFLESIIYDDIYHWKISKKDYFLSSEPYTEHVALGKKWVEDNVKNTSPH